MRSMLIIYLIPNFTKDKVIAEYADKNELVVITKDVDFRNSYYIKNSPKKLIRICLGNLSTAEMITIMDTHLNFFDRYLSKVYYILH